MSCLKVLELKVPPPLIFILTLIVMSFVAEFQFVLTTPRLLIASFVCLIAITIAASSIFALYKASTTINPHRPDKSSTLIVEGIFKHTRNPMYLALVILQIAWSLFLDSYLSLAAIVPFIIYITYFQIKPEEEFLNKKFAKEYSDYQSTVRRWL